MSAFGRAVSLLRQTEVVLTEQVKSVDLRALRADTEREGAAMTMETAVRWRTVLAAVGPSLAAFGAEMQRVDMYVWRRHKTLRSMRITLSAIQSFATLIAVFMFAQLMRRSRGRTGQAVTTCSVVAAVTLVVLMVVGSWNVQINETYRRLAFQVQSPLLSALSRFNASLGNNFIVLLVAAVTTGGAVEALLQRRDVMRAMALSQRARICRRSPAPPGDCSMAGIGPCDRDTFTVASLPGYIQRFCTPQLLDAADALIELQELGVDRFSQAALWRGVRSGVLAVGGLVLMDQDDDARTSGPLSRDDIQDIVDTQLAPLLKLRGVELRGAFGAIDTSRLTPLAFVGDVEHANLLSSGTGGGAVVSEEAQARCFRSCMATPACAAAYYDTSTGRCLGCADTSALSSLVYGGGNATVFLSRPAAALLSSAGASGGAGGHAGAAGGMKLTLCRSQGAATDGARVGTAAIDFDPLLSQSGTAASGGSGGGSSGGSSGGSTACQTLSVAEVYRHAVTSGAAASTMLNQATDLSRRVSHVLRRARYAFDIDEVRPLIDARLIDYYGADVYESTGVSRAVDVVLARARTQALEMRAAELGNAAATSAAKPGSPQSMIDPERLRQKVRSMSAADISALRQRLVLLRDSAVAHRDFFPVYRPTAGVRTATLMAYLGGFAMLAVLVAGLTALVTAYIGTGAANAAADAAAAAALGTASSGGVSLAALWQLSLLMLCGFIVAAVVFETTIARRIAKIRHNQDAVDNNGEMLVAAAIRVAEQFDVVATAEGKLVRAAAPDTGNANANAQIANAVTTNEAAASDAAAALLSDCGVLLIKYDECNSITSGMARMPPPIADVVMYVAVALVFLLFAMYVLWSMAPADRSTKVRSLTDMRARVKRGEATAIAEAIAMADCNEAAKGVSPLTLLGWLGVLCAVILALLFLYSTSDATDQYESSLATEEDCV